MKAIFWSESIEWAYHIHRSVSFGIDLEGRNVNKGGGVMGGGCLQEKGASFKECMGIMAEGNHSTAYHGSLPNRVHKYSICFYSIHSSPISFS